MLQHMMDNPAFKQVMRNAGTAIGRELGRLEVGNGSAASSNGKPRSSWTGTGTRPS